MNLKSLAVIVLAAGKGTRFGENHTKLLHPVLGKPLIYYPLQNLKNLGVENIISVVSDSKVEEEIRKYIDCKFVYQKNLTGTADAVKLALNKFSLTPERWEAKVLMVINGDDTTLYSKKTLEDFLNSHESSKAEISLMTINTNRKMAVGRIIRDSQGQFSKILEYKEYQESGLKSTEINCGVYLINLDFAKTNLPNIPKNPNGEYYLTDLLNNAREKKDRINLFVLKNHSEWIGINDKKDLKYAEALIKKRSMLTEGPESNKSNKSVHFLGIAGSGTSACAKIAQSEGFKVTGCDKSLTGEFFEAMQGIEIIEGHHPDHLNKVDILAVSPAVLSLDPDNPELSEAVKRGIKILTWQEFLGKYLTAGKFVIAVSGTHGKSTTTAMVGKILEDANLDPTVLLGATTSFWGSNFRIGRGKYFVIEADEFNDNFLNLNPAISVVTNIEFDHPEYFKDFSSYQKSFRNFFHNTRDLIIANLGDTNSKKVLDEKPGINEASFPPVVDFSKNTIDFPLKVIGDQNLLNASAAFNLGLKLGIPAGTIKESLMNFPGIGRRMEFLGEINGAKIYSDFAHHPTAVRVTSEQIRKHYPDKKIRIVYQPHMFSRTKALFKEFVEVFKNLPVDEIAMLDIYPSREKDTGLIKTQELVEAINDPKVNYSPGVEEILAEITPSLSEKDVVIFMGAGDIDSKIRSQLSS